MPIGINSPARNLFVFGSSGASATQDFLTRITPSPTDTFGISPTDIVYEDTNQQTYLAGTQYDFTYAVTEGFVIRTTDGDASRDIDLKLKGSTTNIDVTINALKYDSNLNIFVCGATEDFSSNILPHVTKFDTNGNIVWSRTFQAGGSFNGVVYTDLCLDQNDNVYACGNNGDIVVVSKYDQYGTCLWTKTYEDTNLAWISFKASAIAINSKDELIVVGRVEATSKDKGFLFKMSTNGELLWSKTFEVTSEDYEAPILFLEDVYVDDSDQIYVVGYEEDNVTSDTRSFIMRMTREGNLMWQTRTNTAAFDVRFRDVSVDSLTGQSVVIGECNIGVNGFILLQRYSTFGKLIWSRKISSPNNRGVFANLFADPSYIYIAYADENSTGSDPESFLFGKLSVTGSGLGAFAYPDGQTTQDYVIETVAIETNTLYDGSMRLDVSDFQTYPHSAINVMFGDISGGNMIYGDKKPVHDDVTNDITSNSLTGTNVASHVLVKDIVRDNNLLLNYDFGNEFTYDRAHNLINYSVYDSSNWTNGSGTYIANDAIAPDGTLTAGSKTRTADDYWVGIGNRALNGPGTYVFSAYLRSDTNCQDKLYFRDQQDGPWQSEIVDVTTEWQRFYIVVSSNTGNLFSIQIGGGGYPLANNKVYFWGAQLEKASIPSRHIKTSGTAIGAPTTVKNLSSSSYTGTINEPTFSPNGYFEHEGTAQTAGGIFATNSGLPTGSSPRTMEAWVYMDTLGAGANPGFLTYGNDAAGQQSGLRYVGTGLQVSFWTGTYDFNTGYDPGFTHFFHYVATYDNNDLIKAYVNGSIIGQKDLSATPLNTVLGANLTLFRVNEPPSGPNYYPHDGRIGEVRIYNRALSDAEIYTNYFATRNKYPAPDLFVSGLTTTLVSQHLGGYSDFNTETSLVDSSLSGTDISIDTNANYSLTTFNGLEVVRVDETTAQLGSFTNLSSLPTGTSWSCSMWVYYDADNFDVEGHRTFFSSDTMRLQWDNVGGGNTEGLWKGEVNIGGSPVPSFETDNTDGYNETLTIANFLNRWNHIMYTSDGTNVKLYWDGTLQSTVAASCAFRSSSTADFGIGYNISSLGGGDSIERETGVGYIGGFNIWSSALSSGEAGIVFESERRRYGV